MNLRNFHCKTFIELKQFRLLIILFLLTSNVFGETIINVKNYGAKGNGETDDTKSIQSAIDNAPENSIIYFPKGTFIVGKIKITANYLENYCLRLKSNLSFFGDGNASVIRFANNIFNKVSKNASAHMFYGNELQNISFSKLMIDMNGSKNRVPKSEFYKNIAAVLVIRGRNLSFQNITFKNSSGTTMLNIMGKGSNLSIENNQFLNGGNYVGSIIANKNQKDFSFIYSEWDSTLISNNKIQQQDINIALENYCGGIEIHGSNSKVSDNTIIGCWPAIYITSSGNDTLKNIIVENNQLLNCINGISFWLIKPMKNIFIRNNIISLTFPRSKKVPFVAGILFPNGNMNEYNEKLANNATSENLIIRSNTVTADTMNIASIGIILHSVKNTEIDSNIIKGMNRAGISLTGSKWGIDSLIVKNNIFSDFRPGIDDKAVNGFIIISDTYSGKIKNAPGMRFISFDNNRFLKKKDNAQFFGAFIALPEQYMNNIQLKNNFWEGNNKALKKVIVN